MRDIVFFPRLAMIERIILNSLAGEKILRTVSVIRPPVNPIGLVTFLPSMEIATIVDEMSLRSS